VKVKRDMDMKSVAVIPAFNTGGSIGEVVRRTLPFVDHVIVVDDGSLDNTASEAELHDAMVISLEKNRGKAHATKVGLSECSDFEAVVMLDSDLQHCPEEIPKFLHEIKNGADLCIGSRFLGGPHKMPFGNWMSNRFASRAISLIAKQPLSDPQSGFRALKGEIVSDLELRARRYSIEHIMILEAAQKNYRIKEVPISCIYGGEESHIKIFSDTLRVTHDILRFVLR
jgi:glycosyltransferase involved in cell wall biosynthesis